ncbi:MAG: hypothetical protein ACRYHQ_35235 [Janthinobacterium lividum]
MAICATRQPRRPGLVEGIRLLLACAGEAEISRLKRVIGDVLRSRTDRRRMTEVNIAVEALNRMLELGRAEYVRIA